jgi:Flp pilus assembly protein TadD
LFQGDIALARGDMTQARSLYENGRPAMEAQVRDHPDDSQRRAHLGLLYAYLGRKEDAIRESRRAIDLRRERKDAVETPLRENNLAMVYALIGETDQAIALIERLLSAPGAGWGDDPSMTLAELRLRWQWDPLRTDPRFKKILAGPEPKTAY